MISDAATMRWSVDMTCIESQTFGLCAMISISEAERFFRSVDRKRQKSVN